MQTENEQTDSSQDLNNSDSPVENPSATETEAPVADGNAELAEMKDKYLRLYSDFDNFRRRTAKEKTELFKTAGEEIVVALLPVLDDFERALKAQGETPAGDPLREGIELVHKKLYRTLESKGLKPMEAQGQPFNMELHESITQIPAPSDDLKGKVVDVVEKGYYLHDKVIRFAKVVIGA